MTVEQTIFSELGPLVGNRVYPDLAPNGAARPFVVYSQVGGEVFTYLEGDVPDKVWGRYQIDAYADSRAASVLLSRQVEARMTAALGFQAKPMSAATWTFEPDVLIFGAQQDFRVFSTR